MPLTPSFQFVSDLPTDPALYVLYGGTGRGRHIAYVGISGNLRSRIRQHFVRRDSSVVTGTSAASLNPDLVTGLEWWLSEQFEDRDRLQAAELVAFEALEPTLRSRGRITEEAEAFAENDEFAKEVRAMLEGEPTGTVEVPRLSEALSRIERLEEQVGRLQKRLREIEDES
jgi:DNA repair ATPase RecN